MRIVAGRGALPSDPRALGERLAGAPLAVLLDVDGTLAPIAPRPEDAAVPPDTVAAVRALVARPRTHVGLVSGRGAVDARRLVGVGGVWAAGNHGFEVLDPDGTLAVAPEVGPWEFALAAARERIRPLVATTPGALLEDKGATMSVHYRLVGEMEAPAFVERAEEVGRSLGLRVTQGRKVVELRPPVAIDKGTAVLALAARLGADAPGASIVFAGDDTTDEDAMRALREWRPRTVTIHVEGDERRETAAEFVAGSPAVLARWLRKLAGARGQA